MIIEIKHQGKIFQVDTSKSKSIAINLNFNGLQPNTYGVDKAKAEAYRDGSFVGDVNQGGSCNFEQYTLVPHCNGTHTECIGHISQEKIYINDILKDTFIPTRIITVPLIPANNTIETYNPKKNINDLMITADSIRNALKVFPPIFNEALILRTSPNEDSKRSRDYTKIEAPYFSSEAMQLIVELKVKHLLVDFPSVDRTLDEGKLSNHRLFWGVPPGIIHIDTNNCSHKTITEMVFVNNEIEDGDYFLNIQIPAFVADAAPSRPIVFPITKTTQA